MALVSLSRVVNSLPSYPFVFNLETILCREREIRAAEERLLEKDIPRTDEEYEKLVRSSPNSSYVWIKYMEFVLSTANVEKARSIAERYSLTKILVANLLL